MSQASACPFHSLPGDGTPLKPSPQLAEWRNAGAFVPLGFQDGHEGLIATRYSAVTSVLQDPRFSMRPSRMPLGPDSLDGEVGNDRAKDAEAVPLELPGELDESGRASEELLLLNVDGSQHAKLRRAIMPRFSVRQARNREDWIRGMVAEQIHYLKEQGPHADLWRDYALHISARTHCHVIGVPDDRYEEFVSLFVEASTAQQKYDFIRRLLDERRLNPGEDVITDLLNNPDLDRVEVESLLRLLMGAGRDSVAYMIATASTALLTHSEQLTLIREQPEIMRPAIEEFMRVGAMFVTMFARTATEDVEIDGFMIPAGTSVSVSPVAANRDPGRWSGDPESFDVTRDAFGHLGFGYGIHQCVGQQVARIEIREAIVALLHGFPDMRLIHAEQLTPQPFAHPVAVYEAGAVIVSLDGTLPTTYGE